LKVEHGRVQIVFDSGQGQAGWSSTLDPTSALALHAPAFGERAETWQIGAAPLLHPVFSGVPESSEDAPDGEHVFHPLPGETLRVEVARPAALSGDSIAFDQVTLDATRGDRALESMLTLNARSTHDGHLALPVQRGVQTFTLRFRGASAIGMSSGTPPVSLHARAANVKLSLSL